jgi:hypothetical protein
VATIEVKSYLHWKDVERADKSAKKLSEEICREKQMPIMCLVFGFFGEGPKPLRDRAEGERLLRQAAALGGICLLGKFSWMNMRNGWAFRAGDAERHEETKRFLAITIDNVRKLAEQRWTIRAGVHHRDWVGAYIRDQ